MKAAKKPTRKGQGHIFQRGTVYWLQYRLDGQRTRVSLGTANLREAKAERDRILDVVPRAATRQKAVQALVQALDTERQVVPLAEVWERWTQLTDRAPAAGTLKGYQATWVAFQDWASSQPGGPDTMEDVQRKQDGLDWAERYRIHLDGQNLAPSTFNQYLGTLRNIWDTLRVSPNPWRQIKLKKLTHRIRSARKHSAFTPAEIRLLLEHSEGELRTLIEIGIYTGQRLFDCVNLAWSSIDWDHRVIRLVQRKTGKQVVIPILPPLFARLKALEPGRGPVLPELAAAYGRDRAVITKRFHRVLELAGIQATKPTDAPNTGRRIADKGFHSLRHTFVTECRKLGLEEAHIAAVVGHESLEMTRHYTDIGEAEMVKLSERLGSTATPVASSPRPAKETLDRVRALVQGITSANWQATREELLSELARAAR